LLSKDAPFAGLRRSGQEGQPGNFHSYPKFLNAWPIALFQNREILRRVALTHAVGLVDETAAMRGGAGIDLADPTPDMGVIGSGEEFGRLPIGIALDQPRNQPKVAISAMV
jgi:hypothetical protein